MTGWQRLRAGVNWLNLMTPLGMLVGAVGGGRLQAGPAGLWVCAGYRLRFPDAGAFTLGNVITTRHDASYVLAAGKSELLGHESRHSVQAAIFGPLLLPLYALAAGYSWAISADLGGRNVFEVWAGLESGQYVRHPLRPAITRLLRLLTQRPAR